MSKVRMTVIKSMKKKEEKQMNKNNVVGIIIGFIFGTIIGYKVKECNDADRENITEHKRDYIRIGTQSE